MDKILTIAVPTYNMERLIGRCLNSFLIEEKCMAQLEVIVVNDGSSDRSSEIAHKYQDEYPGTFKVVDKANGNYGSCINAALELARGKYFRICDADDEYDTQNLSDYITYLQTIDSDIIFSPYRTLSFDSYLKQDIKAAMQYLGKDLAIDQVDWTDKDIIPYRAMHAICVKTENLRNNGYKQSEGISYTDTEFVFYSILYSCTCSFFPSTIYLYYLGRDGQTMSKPSMVKSIMHFYLNAKRMLDDYIVLTEEIGKGKQFLLFRSIMSCINLFIGISLRYIRNNKEQVELYNNLVALSLKSVIDCPIEKELQKDLPFKLWRSFNIPPIVFYCIYNNPLTTLLRKCLCK